jgi:hypothetical protein
MNQLPTLLSLVLLVTLPETSVAADTNLHAARKAAEPYQISPAPTDTCSIYIQGRYSECTRPTKTALFDAGYSAKCVTLSLALRSSGDAGRSFGWG